MHSRRRHAWQHECILTSPLCCVQVLTFPYDLVHDTVDKVISEMQEQHLQFTATDLELVASAMREVIAHHAPGLETISSIGASLTHVLPSTMLQ